MRDLVRKMGIHPRKEEFNFFKETLKEKLQVVALYTKQRQVLQGICEVLLPTHRKLVQDWKQLATELGKLYITYHDRYWEMKEEYERQMRRGSELRALVEDLLEEQTELHGYVERVQQQDKEGIKEAKKREQDLVQRMSKLVEEQDQQQEESKEKERGRKTICERLSHPEGLITARANTDVNERQLFVVGKASHTSSEGETPQGKAQKADQPTISERRIVTI